MEQTGNLNSKITVTINKCEGPISSKSSHFNLLLKSEYCGKVLSESTKIPCSDETSSFDYSIVLPIAMNDISTANELANNPIVVHAYEIMPKEKKQKEEKVNILGYFVIDLLQVIENQSISTAVSNSTTLIPNELLHLEELQKTGNNCKFFYQINWAEILFSKNVLSSWTRLSFTIDTLYVMPETMNTPNNTFIASILLPLENEREEIALYFNGHVKQGNEKQSCARKYPKLSTLSKSLYRETVPRLNQRSSQNCIAEMNDVPFGIERHKLETQNSRIEWNIEFNFYIDEQGMSELKRNITKNRFLGVEICAFSPQQNLKVKKVEDESQVTFHGISFINFWPLLYPGETNFEGAFSVKAYDKIELTARKGRKKILTNEFLNVSYASFMAKNPSKAKKDDKKEIKKTAPKIINSPSERQEQAGFEDGKSFLTVKCAINNPMVAKRTREQLAESVYKYVVSKSHKGSQESMADKVVVNFQEVVSSVSDSILAELCKLMECSTIDESVAEKWESKLMCEINSSDIYYEIKEKVKFAIINIVREKYLKKSKIESENELNNFLSDLYMFLMDQIHIALNKKVSSVNVVPEPEPFLSIEQLEYFAEEACSINRFELGVDYIKQILARLPNSAKHWLKLAVVSMRVDDLESSLYYVEQCLFHDPMHYDGQIFASILNAVQNNYIQAEEIMQYNVELNEENNNSLIIMGLIYEQLGNDLKSEMAFRYATQNTMKTEDSVKMILDEVPPESPKKPSLRKSSLVSISQDFEKNNETEESLVSTKDSNDAAFLAAARYLYSFNLILYAEKSLSKIYGDKSTDYNILICQIALYRQEYAQFDKLIDSSLVDLIDEPVVWALIGHSLYERREYMRAVNAYNRYIDMLGDKSDQHAVLLRLSEIYLTEQKYSEAKYTYKLAIQQNPTHMTWLGLGISCYRIEEIEEAELALCEANCLNSLDLHAWTYLSLICLKTNRKSEAEQSFKYAIRLGLREYPELFKEVTDLQEEMGFGNPQFNF